MIAEILSIGTELLLGDIIDTNAAFLSQRLAELGIPLYFRDTVGDNPARLEETLRLALRRADVIICTGGIGPTQDDITTAGVAAVFEEPLELYPEGLRHIEAFFKQRGRPVTEKQVKQAMLPHGAIMVPNPNGTAPGYILEKAGKTIIVFPGPPQEMQPMWQETVGPYLRTRSQEIFVSRTLRFSGIGEGALEQEIEDLITAQTNPTIAPYAKFGEVHIRITARARREEEGAALIAPVEAEMRRRVGQYCYGIDNETLELVVGRLLRARGLTLAVAESCTGGLLGSRITNIAGSSDYFLGGVISYSNELKVALLGVSPDTLAAHGAVSEETAREMAAGVVRATGASLGVSITGIAGPGGGTAEKPVGLVYLGLARPDAPPRATRHLFWGDRPGVRARAAQEALALLWNALK